jgi:hypothetical protein
MAATTPSPAISKLKKPSKVSAILEISYGEQNLWRLRASLTNHWAHRTNDQLKEDARKKISKWANKICRKGGYDTLPEKLIAYCCRRRELLKGLTDPYSADERGYNNSVVFAATCFIIHDKENVESTMSESTAALVTVQFVD